MAYSDDILATSGLVGYWRLNEASGDALDSKAARVGTVNGALTRQVPGLTGEGDMAMQSDGAVGKQVSIPGALAFDASSFSVECWIKPTTVLTSRRYLSRSSGNVIWIMGVSSGSAYYCQVRGNDGTTYTLITTAAPYMPVAGRTDHLVLVFTPSSMKFYVNGVAVPNASSPTPALPPWVATSTPIGIFAENTSGNGFSGVIDEVAFYNVALTAQQVSDHYLSGTSSAVGASDTPSGTLVLSGSRAESSRHVAAVAGSLVLSGSSQKGSGKYDAPTGALGITGTKTERSTKLDRPADNLLLTGRSVDDFSGIGLVPGWRGLVREVAPLRLHMDAITPLGRHHRWGSDEPDASNVFSGARLSSTMPGGFESLDATLPRKPGVNYSDMERFTTLRVLGVGGWVAGEYRLERAPQVSGDQMAITPSAVGWQANLEDDKSVVFIGLDRELGAWQPMSRQQSVNLNVARQPRIDPSVTPDETTGVPALRFDLSGAFGGSLGAYASAWYDAGPGNLIDAVQFQADGVGVGGSATWLSTLQGADSDLAAGAITVAADNDAANRALALFTLSTPKRWLILVTAYEAALATDARRTYDYKNVVVIGSHRLPLRGAVPNIGLLASDVIAYVVKKWATRLVINADSIQVSDFSIQQLAFKDLTTAAEIIKQSNRFHLNDWAVWEGRTFYYHERGQRGRKWRARVAPAQLSQTGPQVDRLWESVIVQYNDVDGSQKTVGPPGSSADTISPFLKDTDPENPANKLGIIRRDILSMGVSTAAGAIEVGRRFLEEQKLLDRSGQARIVGHVMDDRGVMHPYYHMRAGDTISFIDANDRSYRRIVKVDLDVSSMTASLDLDAPPEGLQALLERLGVAIVHLGL